jgi:hypothetical protein
VKSLPLLLCLALTAAAQNPTPPAADDSRLAPLKDLDGYFPWTPSASPADWQKRAEQVRMQMRVSLGIWPEPTRTPLNAVVHGRVERDEVTVEKVFFEAMPGFFVTGNLYRPKSPGGKVPAVLCPHGHWNDARFMWKGDAEIKKEIANGEERFEVGGRSIFQSIGVHLARMGCVAFVYDMIGYCDSQQISFDIAHKFAKQRPEMISPEPGQWGFFSPQAESNAQSIMGLQTWSSIRALDFLCSLPEVDPNRLACTGASGGGTQTMILGALDPRLAVACPAVMVSTAMQGGCTCENASGLRVGTGNIEFAALFAPKPMGMTSAKDWTIDMPTKGFPDLQKHWAMLGTPDNVKLWPHPEFGHNYNIVTREHIYGFFNEHLKLGLPAERLKERDYEPLTREQLSVWNAEHPQPPGGPEFEKKLLKWWYEDAKQQMEKDIDKFWELGRTGIKGATRRFAGVEKTGFAISERSSPGRNGYAESVLTDMRKGSQVAIRISRRGKKPGGVVLFLSSNPATAVLPTPNSSPGQSEDAQFKPYAEQMLNAGLCFVEVELFSTGASEQPVVKNPRESAAYTFGYNEPEIMHRVDDVLAALGAREPLGSALIGLVALNRSTAAAAAISFAVTEGMADALVLDTEGFRFQSVSRIRDPLFFPSGAKYGDVPGLLALGGPQKLFLMGEGKSAPDVLEAAYERVGKPDTLRLSDKRDLDAAVKWLIEAMK